MRLRSRLALYFAPLAIIPLALVVPSAIGNLRRTLAQELDAQVERGVAAAEASLSDTRGQVSRAVAELAASEAVAQVASDVLAQRDPGGVRTAAERLMRTRGLTALSLLAADGTVVSSGHLPARVGDVDRTFRALAERARGEVRPVLVELADESGLSLSPALVSAERADYGGLTLWVVGGRLLDQELVTSLAALTGAEVELSTQGESLAHAGSAAPPHVERRLRLDPAGELTLRFSAASVQSAETGVLRAFGAVVVLGLGLAVLITLVVARRLTRPLEAVTAAARRVAAGDWKLQLTERAGGEEGELLQAFNRMTQELSRTTEQLLASERVAAWQEVARALAHELKNPLTPIRMSLETLMAAQKAQSPEFGRLFRESAGAVVEEVDRLRRIVDEFSRFARLPKPQLSPLALTDWAQAVLSLHAHPPDGVTLRSELSPDVHVQGDRDQLTQVLVNLLKNAFEAMPRGGLIRVRLVTTSSEARVEVEDSGPGIPPEDRARLFEPYFTTKEGGTGLGLAIAARICQEHGGRLEVGGAPGEGATFTIVLPLASSDTPGQER